MVAIADRFAEEAKAPEKRTPRNSRRPRKRTPRFFVQAKNRGPATNNRLLSAKYLDEETSWYYYGFRYYSPELGRWISRDPIGEMGGLNIYIFALNKPVYVVDRHGLDNFWEPPPPWGGDS